MQHNSASPKLPVYFMASFLMVLFLGWVTGASTFASLGNASLIALFVTLGVAWEARHRRNESRQQPTGRQTHG